MKRIAILAVVLGLSVLLNSWRKNRNRLRQDHL